MSDYDYVLDMWMRHCDVTCARCEMRERFTIYAEFPLSQAASDRRLDNLLTEAGWGSIPDNDLCPDCAKQPHGGTE